MQVPVKRTVATPRQYAHAFIKAWHALGYHEPPTKAQCGVLYAQWMVETGGAAMWNFNIGNVKVSPAQVEAGFPWIDLPGTWEIINGRKVTLEAGDPGRRFRAFSSLDEGMTEHLAFLRSHRYAPSWPAVEAGDPDAFARALKNQGYYTAPVEDYARIMCGAHAQWMQMTSFEDALEDAAMDDAEVDTLPAGHQEAPTVPDLGGADDEPPSVIVHSLHLAGLPGVGDDEPPGAA